MKMVETQEMMAVEKAALVVKIQEQGTEIIPEPAANQEQVRINNETIGCGEKSSQP